VNVYLDSGVFIDYLIARGHTGSILRSTSRRGRVPQQLLRDAEACLAAIVARHVGITSTLTCYEVEEAMYRELARSAAGLVHADRFLIPAARAVITQALVTIDQFRITLADLTANVVNAQCANIELQKRGIRAADALHITTALSAGADLFISTDGTLIDLDGVFTTASGAPLRCADTDSALTML
jgi:predicted nucleic acid-binding protein